MTDASAQTVIATIPVGSNPWIVDANPVTNKIYVANRGSDNVSVIDGSTDTVLTTVAVGADRPPAASVRRSASPASRSAKRVPPSRDCLLVEGDWRMR